MPHRLGRVDHHQRAHLPGLSRELGHRIDGAQDVGHVDHRQDTSLRPDELVRRGVAASRSQLIQQAVQERLARVNRTRLAQECAKLKPEAEQAESENWMGAETAWPEY